ncbi:AAA family ATPase [Gimesia sp.]|uniref:AAA family ATPase n=1 Tax=Gimesia sp. TaxID=2024833 RepID=UPI000C3E551B|nr:AAA family ATPase [Gimesia sp.]MAX35676.1 chromosome segregation protein SMC [Gimesia sp.]HAH47707.1 chromosome segregation protein SMC [Planctomycetaceae bacterium]HBL46001.1 chromosome segregation protein SMC [Planctomycetaceae bacterium]|tara:strand:- start:799 stop:1923 length:1125 start_codon:yes stop_codon:yes gene_type:complete
MKLAKPQIQSLNVTGFKSLREVDVKLTSLNLLIGANGAGKSNLASLFEFLAASLDARLDGYVGRNGGPNSLLFQGAKTTDALEVHVTVKTVVGSGTLHQRCSFKPPDSLFYDIRPVARKSFEWANEMIIDDICSVSKDIYNDAMYDGESHPGQLIYESLKSSSFRLHLLDTSLTSPLRTECYIEDNKRLRWDGGNLAAMLYYYKSSHHKIYDRILSTIRKIVPGFDTFEMEPQRANPRNILLNWKQIGSDYLLGPHQISDGSLRVMVLVTLLLQPQKTLPDLIILDEPELGLHPHAMSMIAGLIQAASVNSQLLVCTQSPTFLDEFSPEEVIVAEARDRESQFRRLDEKDLTNWLDDYSLGELWQKNVFGGGPV